METSGLRPMSHWEQQDTSQLSEDKQDTIHIIIQPSKTEKLGSKNYIILPPKVNASSDCTIYP